MDVPSCSTAQVSELPNVPNGESIEEYKVIPMEVLKDDDSIPAKIIILGCDDANEETLIMTIEEAQNYILTKVGTYIRDPNVNPLLVLKNQISTLHDKIKNKSEEFVKLNKMFDSLYRDQVKFLRHVGIMAKLETKTIGVEVNMPWLAESMPGTLREDLLKHTSENLFLQPGASGSSGNSAAAARVPKREPTGPIECIDLTDDVDSPASPATTAATIATSPTPIATTPFAIPSTAAIPTAATSTAAIPTAATSTAAIPTAATSTAAIPTAATSTAATPTASTSASAPTLTTTTFASITENSIFNSPTPAIIPVQNVPRRNLSQHPAPLPAPSAEGDASEVPPKPRLKLSVDKNGIVLQWDLPPQAKNLKILGFEIFGYQEKNNVPVSSALWKKIGCVNPMPLPMSCTLTQFVVGYKYHFSIRALSQNCLLGHFSDPASIMFSPDIQN